MLLEQVWGYRHAADTRLVNVHVQRLRAKVEHDPEHPAIVLTVRGVGYKAGGTTSDRVSDPAPDADSDVGLEPGPAEGDAGGEPVSS
jgi:two-component system response regulator MtrA